MRLARVTGLSLEALLGMGWDELLFLAEEAAAMVKEDEAVREAALREA
jgi:hypothetical protein